MSSITPLSAGSADLSSYSLLVVVAARFFLGCQQSGHVEKHWNKIMTWSLLVAVFYIGLLSAVGPKSHLLPQHQGCSWFRGFAVDCSFVRSSSIYHKKPTSTMSNFIKAGRKVSVLIACSVEVHLKKWRLISIYHQLDCRYWSQLRWSRQGAW